MVCVTLRPDVNDYEVISASLSVAISQDTFYNAL